MDEKRKYKVRGKVWLYPGEMSRLTDSTGSPKSSSGQAGSWHFVNVDKGQSAELKERYKKAKRGFGSIPVKASIGQTSWSTSIFPDKQSSTYLLPLNVSVRRAESISAGDTITFTLEI